MCTAMQAIVTVAEAVTELKYLEDFSPEAVARSIKSSITTISALGAAASASVAGAVYLPDVILPSWCQCQAACNLREQGAW